MPLFERLGVSLPPTGLFIIHWSPSVSSIGETERHVKVHGWRYGGEPSQQVVTLLHALAQSRHHGVRVARVQLEERPAQQWVLLYANKDTTRTLTMKSQLFEAQSWREGRREEEEVEGRQRERWRESRGRGGGRGGGQRNMRDVVRDTHIVVKNKMSLSSSIL